MKQKSASFAELRENSEESLKELQEFLFDGIFLLKEYTVRNSWSLMLQSEHKARIAVPYSKRKAVDAQNGVVGKVLAPHKEGGKTSFQAVPVFIGYQKPEMKTPLVRLSASKLQSVSTKKVFASAEVNTVVERPEGVVLPMHNLIGCAHWYFSQKLGGVAMSTTRGRVIASLATAMFMAAQGQQPKLPDAIRGELTSNGDKAMLTELEEARRLFLTLA